MGPSVIRAARLMCKIKEGVVVSSEVYSWASTSSVELKGFATPVVAHLLETDDDGDLVQPRGSFSDIKSCEDLIAGKVFGRDSSFRSVLKKVFLNICTEPAAAIDCFSRRYTSGSAHTNPEAPPLKIELRGPQGAGKTDMFTTLLMCKMLKEVEAFASKKANHVVNASVTAVCREKVKELLTPEYEYMLHHFNNLGSSLENVVVSSSLSAPTEIDIVEFQVNIMALCQRRLKRPVIVFIPDEQLLDSHSKAVFDLMFINNVPGFILITSVEIARGEESSAIGESSELIAVVDDALAVLPPAPPVSRSFLSRVLNPRASVRSSSSDLVESSYTPGGKKFYSVLT
eukprot:gene27318-34016_t